MEQIQEIFYPGFNKLDDLSDYLQGIDAPMYNVTSLDQGTYRMHTLTQFGCHWKEIAEETKNSAHPQHVSEADTRITYTIQLYKLKQENQERLEDENFKAQEGIKKKLDFQKDLLNEIERILLRRNSGLETPAKIWKIQNQFCMLELWNSQNPLTESSLDTESSPEDSPSEGATNYPRWASPIYLPCELHQH
eukprot:GHVP01061731.1.p1 GENE.GHVP01061731.1~~GHVP01061731.1.p1  ORF type:complete len:192 (+),score=24.37 GHVP01061731.1:33-608(+)